MNLLRRAKMTLGPVSGCAQSPFRTLTMVASMGLLVGYGSIAQCAIFAPAVIATQDHDHAKQHDVLLQEIHSDHDENVKVIVLQDGDSDHKDLIKKLHADHNVQLHKLHSGEDGNVEIVVLQDGEEGHAGLLKKLGANHKIQVHRRHSDKDGNVEVFVTKGGEQDLDVNVELHGHLAEMLHGKVSGNVDHKELARKLRAIADQLDGKGDAVHAKHKHHNIEIHHGGGHEIHIDKGAIVEKLRHRIVELHADSGNRIVHNKTGEPRHMIIDLKKDGKGNVHVHEGDHKKMVLHAKKHDAHHNVVVDKIHVDGDHEIHVEIGSNGEKPNHEIFEFKTDSGKHIVLGKSGDPRQMIIELKTDGKGDVHVLDGDHKNMILHAKKHGAHHDVIVDKIHGASDHKPHAHKSQVGNGKTSGEKDRSMDAMRDELKQLRRELNQLRSKLSSSSEKHSHASKAAVRVIDRLKETQPSSGDSGIKDLIWVEGGDAGSSKKTFTLKKSKDSTDKASPNILRLELETKEQKSKGPKRKKSKN